MPSKRPAGVAPTAVPFSSWDDSYGFLTAVRSPLLEPLELVEPVLPLELDVP